MLKVGLDFGTTNSTLSFIDPQTQRLEAFKMGGADGSYYIPSFVAYCNEDNTCSIGSEAKLSQTDEDYLVFSNFKMLLGENDRSRLEKYGYDRKFPLDCAKDYINNLLEQYRQEQNLGDNGQLESMVITVPEIWVKEVSKQQETGYLSREALRKVCKELAVPLKQLLSEPVAASAFFAYSYHEKEQSWFQGHVLVFDYGGGTLDLSLSEVQDNKITVLECTGKGHDPNSLGKAGVAFDEAVIRRVYEREKGRKLSRTSPEFYELMHNFEEQKIKRKNQLDKNLTSYLKDKEVVKKVFAINSMKFMASDLCESFDSEIKPTVLEALREMKIYLQANGVNIQDRDKFRVIMVGGFSSFYLVQMAVREFFESQTTTDKRFDSCFNLEDTALAISKGATLVANDLIDIEPTCPMTVGLQLQIDQGDGWLKEKDVPILKKGVKISQYREAQYVHGVIRIAGDPSRYRIPPINVFLEDGGTKRYLELDKAVEEVLLDINKEGNRWNIGLSVDENNCFFLHTQDSSSQVKITSIGELIKKISGLILERE
jgi:molecular chaperone DnaK